MGAVAERASWTLDELVRRVAAALEDPAYPGAPNGRIRELPNRRAVRWYTTTGLVDRPDMRGRTAAYGPRHLLQIVAVKRLQAEGLSLAEIQAELAGATDKTLRRVAGIPDGVVDGEEPREPIAATAARRRRFWAEPPAPAKSPNGRGLDGADDADVTVTHLAALRLPGGALLVLPSRPDDEDIAAIHLAARPLLDLLAERGLLPLDERSPS
ncbi:MerR family transcriptional regulator [Mycobacterium sp. Marseille-P9652]|uniref:MerR family transcriptional regulator n=1 Tax=Mycobacterium sp. Marseille-P9652 TaxID=2654950 RepID=UPI0012E84D47|nr:MerR family transcriptional regulator [Mycobacterium sp. Marseille-P9652]